MGLVAFTKTLAREGAKYGIQSICIAPVAASAMTETIMPPEMLANLKVCASRASSHVYLALISSG
jgi:multifunctional beta-oxidation protein